MTPELYALAAQIVALPGWEWRPGMRYLFATGKLAGKGLHLQNPGCTGVSGTPPEGCVPDLDDDATAGVILGLLPLEKDCVDVRQSNVGINIQSGPLFWLAHYWSQGRVLHIGRGATLGEAIARLAVARGGWL